MFLPSNSSLLPALLLVFCTSLYAEQTTLTASTLHYPPYEYMEAGQAKGIAVDLIREALKRTDHTAVEVKFYPWKRAVFMTQTGQRDMLFNAGKNKARQAWGHFVDSVLIQQSYVLFKRKSDQFSLMPDLSNVDAKTIAVRQGFLYGSGRFRQALDKDQFKAVTLSNSTQQSVRLLLNNRVDLFVGDLLPVMHYLKTEGLEDQVEVVQHLGKPMEVLTWPTYLMFSKAAVSYGFVQQVNAALEAMKADGSFAAIYQRYAPSS